MHRDDQLPRDLQRAVDLLRETPDVRPEWIESVTASAAADRSATIRPARRSRRWSIDPWMAVAAGIACIAIGAAGMYVTLERRPIAAPAATVGHAPTAPVQFRLIAPGAASVHLVGDFNAWNPAALPMRRSKDGSTWVVEVGLAPGRYTYAFVVDGRLARDPSAAQSADDDFGVPSSVLLVRNGET